ncbi:formyltetrahydrofolate deformylase [Halosegnis rubeus]|mgnify:FL=1|jgi:formyltetrahydrofolate deformylase|uniref:Formyltetrahydrofolate deformylase n=1 Tax=Halosegnis rubeus TaxID=2212850 RepID=A0A5N5UAS6_9EURY|nr:formyltetrahydrofolate deformylase [Halosegnis rubeus]KAB7517060.1 formyltetrahydrofolate deformylase [Halosegnis rubeus]KAB7519812.1 formyltetrahydrofolate deformylase [Halosegnis rubeus]
MTREYTQITVIGEDTTGIIARVTTLLYDRAINIEDLDQAVREGLFRMTLHVDTSEMTCSQAELREALDELGEEIGHEVRIRFPDDRDTQTIAVLATKETHAPEALFAAHEEGTLDADISVLISNHSELDGLAADYDVPFHDIGDEKGTPDEDELLTLLEEYDADLIVLARYMRIIGPEVVFRYEDRIINIHPSLLPSFPGARAYQQARQEGVRVGGVTAHYVTTDLDQGPIIAQRAFDVPADATVDELERRGQPLEASALLEAVRLHLDDAVYVHQGRVELRDGIETGDYQLGLPEKVRDWNPSVPVDGEPL